MVVLCGCYAVQGGCQGVLIVFFRTISGIFTSFFPLKQAPKIGTESLLAKWKQLGIFWVHNRLV